MSEPNRREVLGVAGALLAACGARRPRAALRARGRAVVVGAGAFGGWTAWFLRARGMDVTLVDAFGPGNERSSSGGETRLMREDYGANELYMRLAIRAFALWREHQAAWRARLFAPTGRLLMAAAEGRPELSARAERLRRHGVVTELLEPAELRRRWPQMFTDDVAVALHNPNAALMYARDACRAVADALVSAGGELRIARAQLGARSGQRLVEVLADRRIAADAVVFACGPWLGKLFPELFGQRLTVVRRDVLFFGTPASDRRFRLSELPTFGFGGKLPYASFYGFPDVDGRGFKVCSTARDVPIDPDTLERRVSDEDIAEARAFIAYRFPALAGQPLLGTRTCQTADTKTDDFVIDRHPELDNVWVAGGGSGHGYKHGPAVGEYLAARIVDGAEDRELDDAFRLR